MGRNPSKRRMIRRLRRKTKWSLPLLSRLKLATQLLSRKRFQVSLRK